MLGFLTRFVDSNDRELKRIQPYIERVNELEPEFIALSDEEIRERIADIREEVREASAPEPPSEDELEHPDLERRRELAKERRKRELERTQQALDEVLPEVFAAAREAMKRTLGMRHFDVQLVGATVLHQGKIAEMRTGEGKTLVAPLAAILNALAGRGVHVITVNDYLARFHAEWMGRIHRFMGLEVGLIIPGHRDTPEEKRREYAADITYGTNNEFGFDYLRDNMAGTLADKVQRGHNFAIVDEVDSILIDEAQIGRAHV